MAAFLAPYPRLQFFDGNGAPYANAVLATFVAGTSTPATTYADSDLDVANPVEIEADADGRFGPIYLSPETAYKFILYDEDEVEIWSQDDIVSPGLFQATFGDTMAAGARSVTSGYLVTEDDLFVTVASSGASAVYLPAVSGRSQPIAIKNMLTGTVVINANGGDLIDGLSTMTIEAASTPVFPCFWLFPNSGSGAWWVMASHRAA